MVNKMVIWNKRPKKYLESNDLISLIDFTILFFILVGKSRINRFSKYSPSFSIKKVMKITDKIPIVIDPRIEPIEFNKIGIASTLFLVKPSISKRLSFKLMLNLIRYSLNSV